MTDRLDTQLRSHVQQNGLAHARWNGDNSPAAQLLLGQAEPPISHHDVLINLGDDIPLYFSRFDRVLEIVEAAQPEAGRARYQFYRERGYPLQTHKITA